MFTANLDEDYNIRLYDQRGHHVIWRRAVLSFDDVMHVLISPEARELCIGDMDSIFKLARLLGERCQLLKDLKDPVPHVQAEIEAKIRKHREERKRLRKATKEAAKRRAAAVPKNGGKSCKKKKDNGDDPK